MMGGDSSCASWPAGRHMPLAGCHFKTSVPDTTHTGAHQGLCPVNISLQHSDESHRHALLYRETCLQQLAMLLTANGQGRHGQ